MGCVILLMRSAICSWLLLLFSAAFKDKNLLILLCHCLPATRARSSQEPRTAAEIKSFAQQTYNVTFPMFSKVDVNGPNAHPVFQFLRRELPLEQGGGGGTGPGHDFTWNFQKVLVNRHGQPVKLLHQDWHQVSNSHNRLAVN